VLAHHTDFRRVGQGIFQPIGEPVGHGVAEHHDGGCRRRLGFLGRGRAREIRRPIVFHRHLRSASPAIAAERITVVEKTLRGGRQGKRERDR
jgi:hypothetical protein